MVKNEHFHVHKSEETCIDWSYLPLPYMDANMS